MPVLVWLSVCLAACLGQTVQFCQSVSQSGREGSEEPRDGLLIVKGQSNQDESRIADNSVYPGKLSRESVQSLRRRRQ